MADRQNLPNLLAGPPNLFDKLTDVQNLSETTNKYFRGTKNLKNS